MTPKENLPEIGFTYHIIDNGIKIFGEVVSYQGETGLFWVKWSDGETTIESKIDGANKV